MTADAALSDAFAELIRPRRREDARVTEDADFLMMMMRMVRALEARAIDNPEVLTSLPEIEKRLAEIKNVVIAVNAERYAVDPRLGASMLEIARMLGLSKAAASERRARGVAIMTARIDAAGAARYAEAARERAAIETSRAQGVLYMADYRARHTAA